MHGSLRCKPSRGRPGQARLSARRPAPASPAGAEDVARIQRAWMTLDVAALDLQAAEDLLGPFHPTTCHFRDFLSEARRAWDRLRAELGTPRLEAACHADPRSVLTLPRPTGTDPISLIVIGGRTYAVEPVPSCRLAPRIWRLTRIPPQGDGPYHAARLRDGTTRCDCAEWTFEVAEIDGAPPCKHLAALAFLGWI
jgi:hypothetical protein